MTLLTRHVQLVLTDRSTMSKGQELGVLSARTWRLADLGAKHAFLRAGLGWGGMPAELVESDLSRGTLVKIVAEDAPKGFVVAMRAAYRTDAPPGIAGRWFTVIPSYELINGRLGYLSPDEHWNVSLWIKNADDEIYALEPSRLCRWLGVRNDATHDMGDRPFPPIQLTA